MSGGYFDYKQHHIEDIIEALRDTIENEDIYSDETLEELGKGLTILQLAYVYTQRIDWLLSGDDGEENFHERLVNDKNNLGVENVEY